jgi:hypothetical protein
LGKGNKVEDVLSLGYEVIQSKVRPCSDIEAIGKLILRRGYRYNVLLILQISAECLWEIIQLAIEENAIEYDISHDNDSTVLARRPPG